VCDANIVLLKEKDKMTKFYCVLKMNNEKKLLLNNLSAADKWSVLLHLVILQSGWRGRAAKLLDGIC